MEHDELEQYRQVVPGVLSERGWKLVEDQEAFVGQVLTEVQLRLVFMSPEQQKRKSEEQIIEDATVNRYNHIWHAACGADGTWRQRQAFTELFEYLYPIALYRANHDVHIAEESTQKALISIWRNLSKVRDPGAFAGWAKIIVNREVSKGLKKALSRPEIPETVLKRTDDPDAEGSEIEKLINRPNVQPKREQGRYRDEEQARFEEVIKHCLKRSKARQRVIIALFFEQQSIKQIADELGMKPNNIHLLTHRAKVTLQKCKKFIELVEKLPL